MASNNFFETERRKMIELIDKSHNKITLHFEFSDDEHIAFEHDFTPATSICDIKIHISRRYGIKPHSIILIYQEKALVNGYILDDYNIQSNTTILIKISEDREDIPDFIPINSPQLPIHQEQSVGISVDRRKLTGCAYVDENGVLRFFDYKAFLNSVHNVNKRPPF
jgi:hypothetical protein